MAKEFPRELNEHGGRMALTHDKKYMFRCSNKELLRYSLNDRLDDQEEFFSYTCENKTESAKRYQIIEGYASQIFITQDDRYVFLADNHKNLIQFSVAEEKVVKIYPWDFQIASIACGSDNETLYIAGMHANLVQISVTQKKLTKSFWEYRSTKGWIESLVITSDNKYLCAGYQNGC